MANYLKGDSYRDLKFGPQVFKTAQAFPNNTTATLFTVNTGNVMVTNLYAIVTTAVTATTGSAISLGVAPTTGTANTSSIATGASVSTVKGEIGMWMAPQASSGIGGLLVLGTNGGGAIYKPAEFAVAPGGITWSSTAPTGGAVTWYLNYVPLDNGAYVS